MGEHESDLFEHIVTAAGKGQLRGLSLARLKKYASDYGIDIHNVVEKDDLIDGLIAARVRITVHVSYARLIYLLDT